MEDTTYVEPNFRIAITYKEQGDKHMNCLSKMNQLPLVLGIVNGYLQVHKVDLWVCVREKRNWQKQEGPESLDSQQIQRITWPTAAWRAFTATPHPLIKSCQVRTRKALTLWTVPSTSKQHWWDYSDVCRKKPCKKHWWRDFRVCSHRLLEG